MQRRLPFSPGQAAFIGDALTDLQAAAKAGCARVLVRTGKGTATQAAGIPADAITTAWKGESENAVPTEDGVREQANRRGEIIVQ